MNAPREQVDILLVEDSASDALLIEEALTDVQEFESHFVRWKPLRPV